jgi:protoporphyrinogen oxidase
MESLSAQYALRYFVSFVMRDANHRGYIPEGMQEISNRLAADLDEGVVRVRSLVVGVDRRDDELYAIRVQGADGDEAWVARRVVLAVPGPIVEQLVPWLPGWKSRAIRRTETASAVSLGVVLDGEALANSGDLFTVLSVGTSVQTVTLPDPRGLDQRRKGEKVWVGLYRHRLPPNARVEADAWLEDLFRIIPDARGRVMDTVLTRWDHCFAYPAADRTDLLGALQAPVGNLHFAGDYTSATAGTHGALSEGRRVAQALAAQEPAPA